MLFYVFQNLFWELILMSHVQIQNVFLFVIVIILIMVD